MLIRPETPQDFVAIRNITVEAFTGHAHSTQKEHLLVEALREAGALSVSLVAEAHEQIIGHVGFSPITIDGASRGWFGLAPLSVRPDMQHKGIGRALVIEGLQALRAAGAHGCVVLGDPGYYAHFGFHPSAELKLEGVPPEYFMVLAFGDGVPHGRVDYHPAFDLCA